MALLFRRTDNASGYLPLTNKLTCRPASVSYELAETNIAGRVRCSAWLGLKKSQQVLVELFFVRVGDAVRRAGIDDQLGVFDDPR